MPAGMTELSGNALLSLPVRLHGLQLGRPAEVFLDRDLRRVVGLDVLCGDDVHRFLPLSTAMVDDAAITLPSAFVLLEGDELAFYRARAVALRSLRGRVVQRGRARTGTLRDIVIGADGALVGLIADSDGSVVRLPLDERVTLAPASRSAA